MVTEQEQEESDKEKVELLIIPNRLKNKWNNKKDIGE